MTRLRLAYHKNPRRTNKSEAGNTDDLRRRAITKSHPFGDVCNDIAECSMRKVSVSVKAKIAVFLEECRIR